MCDWWGEDHHYSPSVNTLLIATQCESKLMKTVFKQSQITVKNFTEIASAGEQMRGPVRCVAEAVARRRH